MTTILIVEADSAGRARLAREAEARGYRALTAATLADATDASTREPFELGLVNLALGADSGFDAIRAIRRLSPDSEIVVTSDSTSLASAIASYELEAFAFVPQPADVDQLFTTIARALDHRGVVLANRRLMWEQRLINDVGEELRHLVAPEDLLHRVLRRLTEGMSVQACAARLQNPLTGAYDIVVIDAPDAVREMWMSPSFPRPGDRVLATRGAVRIHDLHDHAGGPRPAPVRSSLSVPMFAGDALLGVLSIASTTPGRFSADDEQMLGVIANQVAVGVQNARLHASVQAGKQEWEATFDAIGDPIAVFNRHGRLLRGNTALAAYAGMAVTSLPGRTCDQIGLCGGLFPDCAVGRAAGRACVHGQVTRPGDRIFSVMTCPVVDPTDGAAIVQIAKDVTHDIRNARRMQQMSDEIAATNGRLLATVERLKATQAQLLQAEKLSAIGQLVAGVAHELNNPLTSVIGYAQLLQEEVNDAAAATPPRTPSGLADDLRRIAEESERAARIVRNLLAFARRQSAAHAEQDIADLIARVVSLRTYEFRLNAIELDTAFEPGLPPVLGDGGQLQQALLNLLLNAEQAMRNQPTRRVTIGARRVPDADAVEIVISDTGHGIPDENLRKIFDPFFTTREVGQGTGLGLSICYGIVRDHGGQISVESRVNQGTTFTVLLPARAGDERLRVLVAHRDPTERDYVAAALTGWGHTVIVAEGAHDARTRLESGAVDAAFVDRTFIGDSPATPRGSHVVVIPMCDAGGTDGVAAPFELSALRASLRAVTGACA